MTYQIHGYFENPRTSRSREISRFTYKDDLDDIHEAYRIARQWVASDRYPFVFVYDTITRIDSLMMKEAQNA